MDFIPFIEYCNKHIKGDEKGEAQIFLDHFFTALGYINGLKGAGADCEYRVRDSKKKTTSFADLVWKPRVLIEMKKRDEDPSIHYQQAFSYWMQLVPNRPKYVILCNFDEFWIYNRQSPVWKKSFKEIDLYKLGIMVITITSRSTRAEIAAALKKLEGQRLKRRTKTKKVFDARDYCGVIRLKQDPLQLQKQWRNEWE